MDNKQLVLTAIALLDAIEQNNLNETKSLVEELNNNFVPTPETQNLNQLISYMDILENKNFIANEALEYCINNLNNILNIERVKWLVTTSKLLNDLNKEEIANFILNFINQNNEILDYEMATLVQLCVTIDRYDLLNLLREKIEEGNE